MVRAKDSIWKYGTSYAHWVYCVYCGWKAKGWTELAAVWVLAHWRAVTRRVSQRVWGEAPGPRPPRSCALPRRLGRTLRHGKLRLHIKILLVNKKTRCVLTNRDVAYPRLAPWCARRRPYGSMARRTHPGCTACTAGGRRRGVEDRRSATLPVYEAVTRRTLRPPQALAGRVWSSIRPRQGASVSDGV